MAVEFTDQDLEFLLDLAAPEEELGASRPGDGHDRAEAVLKEVRAVLLSWGSDAADGTREPFGELQDGGVIAEAVLARLQAAFADGAEGTAARLGTLLDRLADDEDDTRFAGSLLQRLRDADFREAFEDHAFARLIGRHADHDSEDADRLAVAALSASTAANGATEAADAITGTEAADVIDALGGNDVVAGLGGNDELSGGAGNDELSGGAGNDWLDGGAGNDMLSGGDDGDELHGGTGHDELFGNAGNDELFGEAGNDALSGDAGHDLLDGGEGADELAGGAGNDELKGAAGDDALDGGEGSDTAVFSGNRADYDITTGADGVTTVVHRAGGADGRDTLTRIEALQFADQSIATPPHSGTNPDPDPDPDPDPNTDPTLVSLTADANGEYAVSGLGELRISTNFFAPEAAYRNVFGYYLADANGKPIGGAIIESVARETSNDPTVTVDLTDYPGAVKLGFFIIPNGAGKNPSVADGQEVSFQKVGSTWHAYAGTTKLNGEGTGVYFTKAALNADGLDHMTNNAHSGNQNWEDLFNGGDRDFDDVNATITVKKVVPPAPAAAQTMAALAADDAAPADGAAVEIRDETPADGALKAEADKPLTANVNLLMNPEGISEIRYQWQSSADGVNWNAIPGATGSRFTPRQSETGLALRVALTYIFVDAAFSAQTAHSAPTEAVIPAAQGTGSAVPPADAGHGEASHRSSHRQQSDHDGEDAAPAAANNAAARNAADADAEEAPQGAVIGSSGANLLFGTAAANIIEAGAGPDRVFAGRGDDIIIGGTGDDVLFGGGGNDVIYGGLGDDLIFGGAGDDVLFGEGGNDTIHGGGRNDRIFGDAPDERVTGSVETLESSVEIVESSVETVASDPDATTIGCADTLHGDDGDDIIVANQGDDFVSGGADDDAVFGGSGNDTAYGDAGDDLVSGGSGNDLVDGGAGDDRITGGSGDDIIIGGAGDDLLYGGSGHDRFVYRRGDGNDSILDFEDEADEIDLDSEDAYTVADTDYGRDYVFGNGQVLSVHKRGRGKDDDDDDDDNSGKGSGGDDQHDNSGSGSGHDEDHDNDQYYDLEAGATGQSADDAWAELIACGVVDDPAAAAVPEDYAPLSDFHEDPGLPVLGISTIHFSHEDTNLIC